MNSSSRINHAGVSAAVFGALLASGAIALLVLAIAARRGRKAPPPAMPARRLAPFALAILVAGLLTGIGLAALQAGAESAAIASASGALVALLTLLHARWLLRSLPALRR